uniref:Uncharacterized protein n=1 Tax=Athene cunicularia TaxID=194338 RepID=A0A663NCF2_ATHCN
MDPSSPVFPATILEQTAFRLGCSPTDKKLAFHLDEEDELKHLRECFCIPKVKDLLFCRPWSSMLNAEEMTCNILRW